MSVDYRAGLYYGFEITKEQYDNLEDGFRDEYGLRTNHYSDYSQYAIGINLESVDDCCLTELNKILIKDFPSDFENYICRNFPELLEDSPKTFLYCQVW